MSLRDLAANATPGPWEAEMALVRGVGGDIAETHARDDSWDEADTNARLIALAPEMAALLADMADALETANYWDEIAQRTQCVSCDTHTEEHGEFCEIAPLLARFRDLDNTAPAEDGGSHRKGTDKSVTSP